MVSSSSGVHQVAELANHLQPTPRRASVSSTYAHSPERQGPSCPHLLLTSARVVAGRDRLVPRHSGFDRLPEAGSSPSGSELFPFRLFCLVRLGVLAFSSFRRSNRRRWLGAEKAKRHDAKAEEAEEPD